MSQVNVKITRAEKRGRKIIIVFEPVLFSKEVFAVTPFYDEGDANNQLQHANFILNVMEKDGEIIKADVSYHGYHSTTGYSQLHYPLTHFFTDKKECAINWARTELEEYFTSDRIKQVLGMWDSDPVFKKELEVEIRRRELKMWEKKMERAQTDLKDAMGLVQALYDARNLQPWNYSE